jgi:hypothetical protein
MREDVYRVVKAFAKKKEVLSAQAQRFVDRVVSPLFAAWLEKFCPFHQLTNLVAKSFVTCMSK